MHSGIGGLAHVLAEIRLARPWTDAERTLAESIAARLMAGIPAETDCSYFDGLVGSIGVLSALDLPGAEAAVDRLMELATPQGWPQTALRPPRFLPDTHINDLTLGTAGVLLGAIWARRMGVAKASLLADYAAGVLLAEREDGVTWSFVPQRYRTEPGIEMPNLSHGLAGIAMTLALAGVEFDRADLTAAALAGAEHLVALGVADGEGFVVRRYIPDDQSDEDKYTYGWCHGTSGTSLLFLALDYTGVKEVAGASPLAWHRRFLHSARTSGLPERLHPGFWDNDGRCCGTTGVADVFLDSWQRSGDERDLEFALRLADTLVERAVVDGPYAYWRFIEHRAPEPLLPPGVGWMQGAAGIAAYLFRVSRVPRDGRQADSSPRMDNWFALPRALPS